MNLYNIFLVEFLLLFIPITILITFDILSKDIIASPDTDNTTFELLSGESVYDAINSDTISLCSGDSIQVEGLTYYAPGSYIDTISIENGSDSIIFITLDTIPAPDTPIIAQIDSLICEFIPTVFRIQNYDPNLTYSWVLPSDTAEINNLGQEIIIYFSSPGTYNLEVIAINECNDSTFSESQIFDVLTAPATPVLISGDTMVCSGESVTYCVSNNENVESYFWILADTTIETTDSCLVIEWQDNSIPSLSIVAEGQCDFEEMLTLPIEILQTPTATFVNSDTILCEGDSVNLLVQFTGTGPYDLQYSDGISTFTSTDINSNPFIINIFTNQTVQYSLISVSNAQCLRYLDDSILISIVEPLEISNTTISATCSENNGIIQLTSNDNQEFKVFWDNGNNNITTLDSDNFEANIIDLSAGLYNITTTDINQICENEYIIEVNNLGIVTDTILMDTICNGDSYEVGNNTFINSGEYTITLTNQDGCDSIVYLDLEVIPFFNITIDTTICNGDSVIIGDSIYFLPDTYIDTIFSLNGCDTIFTTIIKIIPVPDAPEIPDVEELCLGEIVTSIISNYDTTLVYDEDFNAGIEFDFYDLPEYAYYFTEIDTQIYCFTAINSCGESSIRSCDTTIVFDTLNSPTLLLGDTIVCLGESITYCVDDIVDVDSFYWELPIDTFNSVQNCQTITWSANYTPVISVGTYNRCGRGALSTFQIEVLERPKANLVNADISLCQGDSSELVIEFTGSGPYDLVYANASEFFFISDINENIIEIPFTATQNDTFTLISVSNTPCGGGIVFGEVAITVYDSIHPNITIDTASCSGDDGSIQLSPTSSFDIFTIYLESGDSIQITPSAPILDINQLSSGNYAFTITDEFCETNIIVDVPNDGETITTVIEDTICTGLSFIVGDSIFTTTGQYIVPLTNVDGCDSSVLVNLVVVDAIESMLDTTICGELSLTIGDSIFTTTGQYIVPLTNVDGCDSSVLVNLVVLDAIESMLDTTICGGLNLTIGDSIFTTTGQYTVPLTNVDGCDSSVLINLVVEDILEIEIDTILCFGDTLIIEGIEYSMPDTLEYVSFTNEGCLTNVMVNIASSLSLLPPQILQDNELCHGDTSIISILNFNSDLTYEWILSDSAQLISFNENLAYIYFTNPGIQNYSLKATNNCGDSILVLEQLEIIAAPTSPVLGIGEVDSLACAGDSIVYCILNTANIDSFHWNLPNNELITTTQSCLTIGWLNGGIDSTFTITPYNECGSGEIAEYPIQIVEHPTATLLDPDLSICQGASFNLIVLLTGQGPFDLTYIQNDSIQTIIEISDSIAHIPIIALLDDSISLVSVSNFLCEGIVSGSTVVSTANTIISEIQDSICAGELYEFNDTLITAPNIIRDTILSTIGCDSIISTLYLDTIAELPPYAGPDTLICDENFKMIATHLPEIYEGLWFSNSNADIVDTSDPETWVLFLEPGSNEFTWRVIHEDCGITGIDTVIITSEVTFVDAENDTFPSDIIPIEMSDFILVDSVTGNDFLPRYANWEIKLKTPPALGILDLDSSGHFTYTLEEPVDTFITFEYCLINTDCKEEVDTATVFININGQMTEEEVELEESTGFSPNGDGTNDTFVIPELVNPSNEFPNSKLYVFNRWSDLVYYSAPYNNDWDGTNWKTNNDLPEGTYIFLLYLDQDSKKTEDRRKGFVTIVR